MKHDKIEKNINVMAILIVLVIVTGYYQQWQMTRRRSDDKEQTQQQQTMQTAMKIMPLFLGFISWTFPAGLVLYFAASAIFRIGQQSVILRLNDDTDDGKSAKRTDVEPEPTPEDQPERPKGPSPHASKKRKKRRRK